MARSAASAQLHSTGNFGGIGMSCLLALTKERVSGFRLCLGERSEL